MKEKKRRKTTTTTSLEKCEKFLANKFKTSSTFYLHSFVNSCAPPLIRMCDAFIQSFFLSFVRCCVLSQNGPEIEEVNKKTKTSQREKRCIFSSLCLLLLLLLFVVAVVECVFSFFIISHSVLRSYTLNRGNRRCPRLHRLRHRHIDARASRCARSYFCCLVLFFFYFFFVDSFSPLLVFC